MPYRSDRLIHIFDCDGVILNSNSLKLSALRSALAYVDSPFVFINWAEEEFRLNFGRTRIQHFEYFTKYKLDGYELTSKKMFVAKDKYTELVASLYRECEVIEQTRSFILRIPANHPIYVVSASDQEELRNILPSKVSQISREKIFGGPSSKIENIQRVLGKHGDLNAIFYGDAVQDAKVAIQSGINFIGLTEHSAAQQELMSFCDERYLKYYQHCLEVVI
jgi:phosphoglycolate phosphatase-like HAD superfamily hydrolase